MFVLSLPSLVRLMTSWIGSCVIVEIASWRRNSLAAASDATEWVAAVLRTRVTSSSAFTDVSFIRRLSITFGGDSEGSEKENEE